MMPLRGHLLISRFPKLKNAPFTGSIALVTQHSEEGSMGLIINNPRFQFEAKDANGIDVAITIAFNDPTLQRLSALCFYGGPVDPTRRAILHRIPQWYKSEPEEHIEYPDNVFLVHPRSTDQYQDKAISMAKKKRIACRFYDGYASWFPNQLEFAIKLGLWIIARPNGDLVFSDAIDTEWERLINMINQIENDAS